MDTSVPRILSGRLNCPVLLAYICDEAIWGYALFYKGSPVDQFRTVPGYLGDGFADDTTPERRAARLTRHFPVEREDILEYLTPWSREEPEGGGPQGDCWQLEDFLSRLLNSNYVLCFFLDKILPVRRFNLPVTFSKRLIIM